jgi:succinate dehydrogenase / fumarate reductase iron-sulfur subunit
VSDTYQLELNIHRYDPDTGRSWIQSYELEAGRILRFTDLLRKINRDQDPTLAWNSSCEHAQCGSCSMIINGRPLLACELLVENAVALFGTTTFTIRPLVIAPLVRDLVVDFEAAYARLDRVKPYIIKAASNPGGGRQYQIRPKDLERYVEATRCINCFCCAQACISSHRGFLGPNAVLASAVRLMDPREDATEERLGLLFGADGVYRCHTSKACSHVCPKDIDVAHFIGLVKQGEFS